MSFRIDDAARSRYSPDGGTTKPLPVQQSEAFQRSLSEALRSRAGAGGQGAVQKGREKVFVVEAGDNLWRIAQENNVRLSDLMADNPRARPSDYDLIRPGDVIFVPDAAPDLAAGTARDAKGVPSGEDGFADDLYARGNALEYADNPGAVDYRAETAGIASDVRNYLDALPETERQDAALRLLGRDWRDAGPAGQGVEDAVKAEGLQTDPEEVVAGRLHSRANRIASADSGAMDFNREQGLLETDVRSYVESLPGRQRPRALQRLFDMDWQDAGAGQTAVETVAKQQVVTLAESAHTGADSEEGARKIIAQAQAAGTPDARYKALANGYAGASPQVQTALRQGEPGRRIVDDAAQWVVDGLKDVDKAAGDAAPEMKMMQRLDGLTAGADKALATRLVTAVVPKIEAANQASLHGRTGSELRTGPEGARFLMQVTSRIAGTPEGDAAIRRLAGLGFYDMNSVRNAIGTGENPAYAITLADRGGSRVFEQDVLAGVDQFRAQVGRDIKSTLDHRLDLDWRSANYQGAMTPDQLEAAVAGFKRDHPDWEREQEALDRKVAGDGEKLLLQIQALKTLPPGQQGAADAVVKRILDDPKAVQAMTLAMQANPGLLDSPVMQNTIGTVARLSDRGRKLAEEAATQWARKALSGALDPDASGKPKSIEQVRATITRFESTAAHILGMSDVDVRKATTLLKEALPQPGETEADVQRRLSTLDQKLETLVSRDGVKAFGRRERLGQLFRGIGFAAAGATLTQSVPKAFADPNARNVLKASADAAGLSQKSIELLSAVGVLGDDNKAVRLFGGSDRPLVKGLGVFGAIFDVANAGDAFDRGDVPTGMMSLTSAAGTVVAALGTGTMAGPIGLGIVIASVIGQLVWGQIQKVEASNRFMNDTSAEFLRYAGFSPAASQALVDQSGDGYSPVPLLAKYAQEKGYDLSRPDQQKAFADWISGMSGDKLATLRDNIHHTLDASKGDVQKFGKTADSDARWQDPNHKPMVGASKGGAIYGDSIAEKIRDGEAAPASVAQLDIALGVLGLKPLPQP